ncbi:MAG: apolipoprotein N-acyltransferase [Spirochaetaceae bacterium]|nr:MAG: apolipoprotein N-acyltransferase [Spirochaetaceae bacterium]
MGFVYVAVTLGLGALLYWGPYALPSLDALTYSEYLYLAFLLAHLVCGLVLISTTTRARRLGTITSGMYRIPEVFFVLCLLLYLFAYVYALNANMDYIQRFIASGGAVRLALDTSQERLAATVKFGPLLLLNAFFYLFWRLKPAAPGAILPGAALVRWALPIVLLSVVLGVVCFPSFVSLEGLGYVAFLALVPLLLVFQANSLGWAVFYGLAFGVLQTMLLNSWLGTYSLVTLQLVSLVFALLYLLFLVPTLWLYKSYRKIGFLILPVAWIAFEYIRSSGFLGYPWGLWGVTQYQFTSLVQIAAVTGVWGVSFLVLLINSGLAAALWGIVSSRSGDTGARPERSIQIRDPQSQAERGLSALLIASLVFLFCLLFGTFSLGRLEKQPVLKRPRLALIQQNADPRKHNYRQTFNTLVALSDEAKRYDPDLLVWSETAFVPNISRWSQLKPEEHSYAALVRDFLTYQNDLERWLLTGNDDYELVRDSTGAEQRLDYNAAILFDPDGNRVRTYRKLRLVPFTEYFPWKQQLPGFYNWLKERDVYLWEPGQERVVFAHPLFRFSTPICFEDAFPDDVRLFVREGAEVIVNISNDYWSLTEVEGQQHGVNAFYRAVENRIPLVRASASGLTGYVDSAGRLVASVPFYEERYLVVDVEIRKPTLTVYTLFGDWFPRLLVGVLVVFLLLSVFPPMRRAF